ncbi:Peroxidase 17 [Bienertia sinuspersici]
MPSPRANTSSLIDLFTKFNLSVEDLVALSRVGKPDPVIDPQYKMELDKLCSLMG